MKKNTLRVIATILACATLASGSATAMADEASLPSMDEVPNSAAIEHEAHSLSVQPTADKQYAYPAEAEASGIFPTKNANALQPLNDTDDVPQSRGAVGNVAKALKVAAKFSVEQNGSAISPAFCKNLRIGQLAKSSNSSVSMA